MSDKVNILLVDDRPEKLLALEAVLEELGQEIVRAYSGRDALRALLSQDFAVILLDVNMPGMDGFETAQMIRQRPSTRDVPIIFVTAYGDETHVARGYSLGAVDYIHAPVVPEVLRSKVAVFVDLFKKTQQVKRQAESLRRRASQLQKLAEASVVISSAQSLETMLQAVTDAAREVIGCHQAITVFTEPPSASPNRRPRTQAFASYSSKYAEWRTQPLPLDEICSTVVFRSRTATRLSEEELLEHPDWEIVRRVRIPPIHGGMLAAPLNGRDATHLGVIYLCDRGDGPFTADDEVIAVQLAQLASIAIENLLFTEEREANRIKDEFLSMLSHELRTPLNAILGWTQLLRFEHRDGELAHGLEVIERNARAQAKLVEDMLDVSRVTSGKLRLNRRPVAFEPIIRAAIDAIRPDAEGKGVSLQCVIDEAGQVNGDPDRLQQVVWNLLSNSVKFTTTGGRIEVRLDRVNQNLRIRVSDTGRGISPAFLPHVFDRFRQADSSSTRKHGGLGIGLTIVRQIVELHGGSVSADSPGEGRGSTFSVILPVCDAGKSVSGPMLARDDAQAPATRSTESPKSKVSPADPRSSIPNVGRHDERDLHGVHLLVVDDAVDTLEFIAHTLRQANAEVFTATSVVEGLAEFTRNRPDVLITDVAMPDRDGYDLIRAIRELGPARGGEVPAIALTAYAREDDRLRALAAGFHMHLAKPVQPQVIVDAVHYVLSRDHSRCPPAGAHSA
jgi:signal transduction histidine kinase/DNA-binding response OmpR family regulator